MQTAKVLDAPAPAAPRPAPAEQTLRLAMEREASRLSDLILSQPPKPLIGYLWAQRTFDAAGDDTFLMQYLHAVLASDDGLPNAELDEAVCAEILACAQALHAATQAYCGALAADGLHAAFEATSGWIWRNTAFDEAFLQLVLEPHDEALAARHGIGAADIVRRIVAIPGTVHAIQERAADAIAAQMAGVAALAAERGIESEAAAALWSEHAPMQAKAATRAYGDLLQAGLCNLSAHTDLPVTLLRDLAYERGGNIDFFAPGAFRGTPLRTLPARVRPLIKLAGDHFAIDPDLLGSVHRPILAGLIDGDARAAEAFAARFNAASRTAFVRALATQLEGARIDTGICYRDVETHQWAENDCLIRLGDTLILVDAQAGAAATIAPPAGDLEHHVQDVREIVTHGYEQCRCFFDYLASAPEVPLFRREGGRYVEFDRIRRGDFKLAFPVGLTLESLAPHAALCSADIAPLLGQHGFMVLSAEDLLMLGRALPAREDFVRYLEFRQAAPPRNFETDHLAAFIAANETQVEPVAETLVETVARAPEPVAAEPGIVAAPGPVAEAPQAEVVAAEPEAPEPPDADEGPDRPREIASLLGALRTAREPGWRDARDAVRGRGAAERMHLAQMLRQAGDSLGTQEFRWLHVADAPPLFIWLQRFGTRADVEAIRARAKAAAVSAGSSAIVAILVHATAPGDYSRAVAIEVAVPAQGSAEYAQYRSSADSAQANDTRALKAAAAAQAARVKPGRNEPCWCGSGRKFKRCHGSV